MLRGVGNNYAAVIASLTKIGIKALSLPRKRLLELIEDMDRADFTHWLFLLRSGKAIKDEVRDEIAVSLQKLLDEAASRTEEVERLKGLAKLAHDVAKLEGRN